MASIYDLKPRFQALLRPLTRSLASIGVTANQVTVAAVILSVSTGTCLAVWPEVNWCALMVPVVLFVRMALNAVDGMLAREHNLKSRLGAVLNEIGDVVSDSAMYLPVALLEGLDGRIIVGFVIFAILSEMTGVVAVQIGATRRYDGPMGKSDRAFLVGLVCLLSGCGVTLSIWANWLFGLACLLLVLTIFNRASRALKEPVQS
ncbi:MAG: CDP-alcohol phosphatidyltransferase family protein [Planctomycetaceae bacterium]|nr:CDP-alcohol phosphatidyltransferase family protein [Planctomycetaceae bacterium]